MNEPEFLEADVVQFLHDQALREYGGLQGIRDEGLLQSALNRPPNKHAYGDAAAADLFDLAAAYAFGLASNHPFNDANKRTAWGCCVLFLKANGQELDASAPDVVAQMVRLVQQQTGEAEFAGWLRLNRRSPRPATVSRARRFGSSQRSAAMAHEKTKSDNDTSTARSAKAKKADEVQQAGSARAGAGHPPVPEGGPAPKPTHAKGEPMPARSRAMAEGTGEAGTSGATVGKAEKQAAAENAALTKEQHGRGHRKSE